MDEPTMETPSAEQIGGVSSNVLAARGTVDQLIERLKRIDSALATMRFSTKPVNFTMLFLQNQQLIIQALAFLLDEHLAAQGHGRWIEVRHADGGGDGKAAG